MRVVVRAGCCFVTKKWAQIFILSFFLFLCEYVVEKENGYRNSFFL